MRVKTLKSLVLYNYRYFFAYIVVAAFGVYFLAWRLGSLPNGLSFQELQTAATNVKLSSLIASPLYPLHGLLQWLSLELFGVNAISIRLPSIIIAATTITLLYTILKKWFGKVTSLLSVAFVLSADWFLFVARSGSGAIEFSFWLTLLIYSMMKLIAGKPAWLAIYGLASALLLFSPFGIYAVIASTVCLFSCAMFRKRAQEAPPFAKLLFGLLPVVALGIIIWLGINDSAFIKALLGIVVLPTPLEFFKNMIMNASNTVLIWPDNNPLLGPSGIFLIRFVEVIFILFGLVMFWITRVNRLNIVIIANAVTLAMVSGLNPDVAGGSLLLIPAAIFFTCGLRYFIHRWQQTFPKNPYARVALYIPLSIMLLAAVMLHFQSYYVLWPRQTLTSRVFTSDYQLISTALEQAGDCVVIGAEKPIQTLLVAKTPTCQTTFITKKDTIALTKGARVIAHRSALSAGKFENTTALTSGTKNDNVRWVVATAQ